MRAGVLWINMDCESKLILKLGIQLWKNITLNINKYAIWMKFQYALIYRWITQWRWINVKYIFLGKTNQEKTHFTVVLSCMTDRIHLFPEVIFKLRRILPKEIHFPIIIHVYLKSCMGENRILEWFLNKVKEKEWFLSSHICIFELR